MATTFLPPPTYADVVIIDPKTNKGTFNPIWLDWFIQVAQVLSSAGGSSGAIQHNNLQGLQGGGASEFFHLTNAIFQAVNGTGTLDLQLLVMSGVLSEKQGTTTAAANNLTLPTNGNYFQISGNTQINLLDITGRQGGQRLTVKFNGTPVVKNNQAPSGSFKPIKFQSGVDFSAAAGNILDLRFDSIDSTWYALKWT